MAHAKGGFLPSGPIGTKTSNLGSPRPSSKMGQILVAPFSLFETCSGYRDIFGICHEKPLGFWGLPTRPYRD